MSQEFDPYFKWLKIPPSEQPPNHYRLLNTARFESDPEIIETAVARLVTLLQNLSTGDQAEHAQRILNDVAKARLCLSDPNQKAEYDDRLRKSLSGSTKKAPTKPSRRKPTPQGTTQSRTIGKKKAQGGKPRPGSKPGGKKRKPGAKKKPSAKSKQKETKSSVGLIVGYAVATVVVAGAALFFLFQNVSQRTDDANSVAADTGNESWQEESTVEANAFDASNQSSAAESAVADKVPVKTPATKNESDIAIGQQPAIVPAPSSPQVSTNPPPTPSRATTPNMQPAPASQATGQLLPHQLDRFESKLDEMVEFQGVPVSAGDSSTGKTRYLRFSRDWDKSIMVFMLTRDVGDELTVADLQKYVGKTVRINGLVERQFGTKRLGVKIQAKDQLEIVE